MRILRWATAGALVLATASVTIPARAEDEDSKAKKEVAAETLKPMSLTGTVEKVEKMKKDGTPMMTWYTLTGEDGVVTHLPKGKVEAFAGMKVKIEGTGTEATKKGKVTRHLETITSIERIEGGK